jgi:two-component system NtrC family response regulator
VKKICRLILEKASYDVIEAEDGEQAIQLVKAGENPLVLDVILTDIDMPKITGMEAIPFFQRQFPHKPIIVLTGKPNMEAATHFMKLGIVD